LNATDFHPLERAENLREGHVRAFKVAGQDVVLVQQGGVASVLEGFCPHAGHPLAAARVIGTSLRCDMHGYLFDVHTGVCTLYTEGPCRALRVYASEVRNGVLGVVL
jgi:nitrite reductase/ring-hydroxylating ferredoxin subunit